MLRILVFLPAILCYLGAQAQCPSGTSQSQLNWEYLDFFPSSGHGSYTNLLQSQTQHFAFGAQRVTLTHNFTGTNAPGEDLTNTAKGSSYGSGMDVKFIGNGTISLSFQSPVQNLRFSIYDVDYSQRLTVTANNAGTPVNVGMARVSGTVLTITGNNTTTAQAQAGNNAVDDQTGTDGTVNVDIAGPLTNVVIELSNTTLKTGGPGNDREYGFTWLSKVFACSAGSFPSNYYAVSQPLPNQPGYVLTVRNNEVYYLDPATGVAKLVFVDPGHTNINSMAYDPINKFIYYTYSLSGPTGSTNANNRALRRYDYNMDTMGVVVSDVRTLGIPTFDVGVESGAASFYNGSLYLGIESSNNSSYESIIWKIDFNSAFAPVAVSQQFAVDGATQDWADFGIADGVLYDFDGHSSSPDFHHMNLLTNTVTKLNVASGVIPRQTGIDWNNVVYNIGPGATGSSGFISRYNMNGGVVAGTQRQITYNGSTVTGSWGDAAEAFRPKMDYGDAPASYDVPGGTPAVHEVSNNLRLGTGFNIEWAKRGETVMADMDLDEGLSYTTILNNSGSYHTSVIVYNNTGANATVCAWMDFNLDGIFSAGEGVTVSVPSSNSPQSVDLFWTGIVSTIPNNSYTFLRIRITSGVNNMTTSNATGFYPDGEVEDYRVLVDAAPLTGNILVFNAQKMQDRSVKLNWKLAIATDQEYFELERSANARDWTSIHNQKTQSGAMDYSFVDMNAGKVNFYRLKYTQTGGRVVYSEVRKIEMESMTTVQVLPNPAVNYVKLSIQSDENTKGALKIYDVNGRVLFQEQLDIRQGLNHVNLPVIQTLPAGIYHAEILINGQRITEKIVKSR